MHFFLVVFCFRQFPEPALGDQAEFVVIVKNGAAMPGDAEIFQQQIAGEDIAARKILDRLTVVENRG